MGFHVLLEKESESESEVVYRFGPPELVVGKLSIRKSDGDVVELEPLPVDHAQAFFTRAVYKLLQHWQRGQFPDRTSWAS